MAIVPWSPAALTPEPWYPTSEPESTTDPRCPSLPDFRCDIHSCILEPTPCHDFFHSNLRTASLVADGLKFNVQAHKFKDLHDQATYTYLQQTVTVICIMSREQLPE
ncbi:hypothetical protein NDU88_000697 [Pleurodeles waltl]|uniref:Uncharacterized protein n=1 Tax=Pleurodeles waltl TaxID=8319 RepID=A0AAV7TGG8_PLEWA|nr:hypothetical protein NDU88_000697 [Pleurodeles waltl]